ncbi:Phospholipase A2-like domain [Popillia japonica]|uniref:Phospholipase A2-like domain n=1 Tax=Popillia japonica TaxID=7064 RepID=A0AAW1K0S4_POPJA
MIPRMLFGTKLQKRLERGDSGINPCDQACKDHDIAYSQSKAKQRHEADRVLQERAWNRMKKGNFGEKAATWIVTNAMKATRKFGMRKRRVPFRSSIIRPAKAVLNGHRIGTLKEGAKLSLAATRAAIKSVEGSKNVQRPRIIPLPKTGKFLPFLIPLEESQRHNNVTVHLNKVACTYRDLRA